MRVLVAAAATCLVVALVPFLVRFCPAQRVASLAASLATFICVGKTLLCVLLSRKA